MFIGDTSPAHKGALLKIWDDLPVCIYPCVQSGLGKGLARGEVSCGVLLGLELLFACVVAAFVNSHVQVAYFAIGTAGTGLAAYLSLGFIRDMSTRLPFGICVWPCVESGLGRGIVQDYVEKANLGLGLAALAGGLLFGYYKEGPLDLCLGLLGAALLAQGFLQILTMDVLSRQVRETLLIDEFYMEYVIGLAILVEVVRYQILGAQDANAQIDRAPMANMLSKVKAVEAKVKAKVAPAKSGKKGMH